ncbi:MAG: GAF and ANTAR domain-containing protein [Jatrophihabitans sp.]|uniref:GAF and ANTAR domain-containing protein n=1 Tax=Jatrophihabitans sp. TaxID=1932789 RepID=UPI00390FDB6A
MTAFDGQAGRATASDPDLPQVQIDSDDRDLATALAELSQMVSDVDDIEDVLVQIAAFALVAIPGADGAGVTLVRSGERAPAGLAWSVTSDLVGEIEHLQYEVCGEGPCLTAMRTARSLTSGSLGSDARWPRLGGRVARLSVHSALAVPLTVGGIVVGAINIYAHERDAFTEHAVTLADQFAGPAAISVYNTGRLRTAQDHAVHLQTALGSRSVIDQAIGIVRSRSGGSEQEAFDRLRQASRAEKKKLALIAQQLVDEAVRRANARHSQT